MLGITLERVASLAPVRPVLHLLVLHAPLDVALVHAHLLQLAVAVALPFLPVALQPRLRWRRRQRLAARLQCVLGPVVCCGVVCVLCVADRFVCAPAASLVAVSVGFLLVWLSHFLQELDRTGALSVVRGANHHRAGDLLPDLHAWL